MKTSIGLLHFLFILLMLVMSSLKGQTLHQESLQRKPWGLQLHNTISYSGFSNALSLSRAIDSFMVYAGIRLLTNKVYLPEAGPWGIQSGINFFYLSSDKISATAGFDYQGTLTHPYNPNNGSIRKMNYIHEVNLSYGILIRLWESFWIGSNMGFGRYFEVYQDLATNTTRHYGGYSGLIRIYLHYEW